MRPPACGKWRATVRCRDADCLVFLVANILMVPFGVAAIKLSVHILRIPRLLLMPIILIFCVAGAYAITNNPFSIAVMLGLAWQASF